jgi:hypothetical protein
MATGVLRPPQEQITPSAYLVIADIINECGGLNSLVTAHGNQAGVCVVILKGNVFRLQLTIEELIKRHMKAVLAIVADTANNMIHIK